MDKDNKIIVFQNRKIRRIWYDDEWYFSIVDVVGVLTDSISPTAYWRKLKQRLKEEGNETVTNCHALKMLSQDGKIAKNARISLEKKTKKKIITKNNYLNEPEKQKRLKGSNNK